ncbi:MULTISPECIES: 4'-phosphopantetheinyl transferase superfamily protein [unclassified Isoptericola]|uniref:4'-phosphopantetheinyl transferase family protein n=1 Tax=unclassified Isoptericola TaxID=2623355 RepID=UPI002713DC84|nr:MULTISPECIES: hypothetical protein [unclassified Isoptericola]MDO8143831.1 hypothetical protein [Isoptericola sp. 178]MDO8147726.1 hypothetical protein [Isoptericola sp. b515]
MTGPPRAVTVWCAPTVPVSCGSAALLTTDEAGTVGSFLRADDRDRFATGRALTRAVLGETLGVPPRGVDVRMGAPGGPAPGKPVVSGGPAFSVSHAGSWVLVAVVDDVGAHGVDVGVDVEAAAGVGRHLDDLAGVVPVAERPAAGWTARTLTRSWVRREAVLKAVGTGLGAPRDDLLLTPPDAAPAVLCSRGALPEPTCLAVHDVELPPLGTVASEHLAAVALRSRKPHHAVIAAVTVADGLGVLARHGVRVPPGPKARRGGRP